MSTEPFLDISPGFSHGHKIEHGPKPIMLAERMKPGVAALWKAIADERGDVRVNVFDVSEPQQRVDALWAFPDGPTNGELTVLRAEQDGDNIVQLRGMQADLSAVRQAVSLRQEEQTTQQAWPTHKA